MELVTYLKRLPPVQFQPPPTAEGSADTQILVSLLDSEISRQEMIRGGWLLTCFSSPCPAPVARFLFHLMAYSPDDMLASCAFRTLETLHTNQESSFPSILDSEFASLPPENCEGQPEWTPSWEDFLEVMENYGMESEEKREERRKEGRKQEKKKESKGESKEESKEKSKEENSRFPEWNLRLVVRYAGLLVRGFGWGGEAVRAGHVTRWLLRLALTSFPPSLTSSLRASLADLLAALSESEWPLRCSQWSLQLLNPPVALTPSQWRRVLRALPSNQRGRTLRATVAWQLLQRLCGVPQQHGLPSEPSLAELVALVRSLARQENDVLLEAVGLVENCLHDLVSLRAQPLAVAELRRVLVALNSQLREVSGYNFVVTQAKDTLVLLATQLQLLASPSEKPLLQTSMREYQNAK